MNINVNNISPCEALIEIDGPIGIPQSEQADTVSATTYNEFREQLAAIMAQGVELIRVNIRSIGGSVQDALLIHGALCELQGVRIETHCYGYVASAATIIAQAASENGRYVASTSFYLIHKSSTTIEGNVSAAQATAALLEKTDQQIAAIYASRSGLSTEHFSELMALEAGGGQWLKPKEVLEAGLADQIEEVSPLKNATERVVNFLRKLIDAPTWQPAPEIELIRDIEPITNEALPTQTQAKEDPVIENGAVTLDGNGKAYIQDAELFRNY